MTRRPSPEEQVAERVRLARRRAAQVAHVEPDRPVAIPAQRGPIRQLPPRVPTVAPAPQGGPHRHRAPQRRPVDLAGRPAPWPRTSPLPIGYPVHESARRRRARAVISSIVIAGCVLLSLAVVVFVIAVLASP